MLTRLARFIITMTRLRTRKRRCWLVRSRAENRRRERIVDKNAVRDCTYVHG